MQGQEELEGENEVLKEAREQATGLARQAGQEQKDCGLDIVPEDFAASALKWGLMEVGLGLRISKGFLSGRSGPCTPMSL